MIMSTWRSSSDGGRDDAHVEYLSALRFWTMTTFRSLVFELEGARQLPRLLWSVDHGAGRAIGVSFLGKIVMVVIVA